MPGPLSHLRIVEGSAFVAAPLAGLTLAQAGADVIRFDPPGGGLDYRRWPRAAASGRSLFWTGLNKGKRPLRSEEHTSALQSLMRHSFAVFCLKQKNFKASCTHQAAVLCTQ